MSSLQLLPYPLSPGGRPCLLHPQEGSSHPDSMKMQKQVGKVFQGSPGSYREVRMSNEEGKKMHHGDSFLRRNLEVSWEAVIDRTTYGQKGSSAGKTRRPAMKTAVDL